MRHHATCILWLCLASVCVSEQQNLPVSHTAFVSSRCMRFVVYICSMLPLRHLQFSASCLTYLVISLNRKRKRRHRWWRRTIFIDNQLSLIYTRIWLLKMKLRLKFFPQWVKMILTTCLTIIKRHDTNFREAISPRVSLLVTLRYLATGDSYYSLMYLSRISEPSISWIIPEVCRALIDVLDHVVRVSKSLIA